MSKELNTDLYPIGAIFRYNSRFTKAQLFGSKIVAENPNDLTAQPMVNEDDDVLDSRPILIFSNGNDCPFYLNKVMGFTLTHTQKYGIHCKTEFGTTSTIQPYEVVTVEKSRIGKFMGIIDKKIFDEVMEAYLWHIGKSDIVPAYVTQYLDNKKNNKIGYIKNQPSIKPPVQDTQKRFIYPFKPAIRPAAIISNPQSNSTTYVKNAETEQYKPSELTVITSQQMQHHSSSPEIPGIPKMSNEDLAYFRSKEYIDKCVDSFDKLLNRLRPETRQAYRNTTLGKRLPFATLDSTNKKDVTKVMKACNLTAFVAPKFILLAKAEKLIQESKYRATIYNNEKHEEAIEG